MKSMDDFRNYYDSRMLPDLIRLEERRKSIYTRMKIIDGLIIALLVGIAIFVLIKAAPAICHVGIFGLFVWIGLTSLNRYIHVKGTGYYTEFKNIVIGKVVSFLGENFTYSHEGNIAKSEFVASKIFKGRPYPSTYKGDDLIQGRIGEVSITMSELYAAYSTGSGKRRKTHTIFKGLFIISVFLQNFKDNIVMSKNSSQNMGDYLPENAMTSFSNMPGSRDLNISYQGNKMYMSISYKEDLFEPKMDKSLLDYVSVADYYNYLKFGLETAEELIKDSGMWGSDEVESTEIFTGEEREINCPSCGGPVPENNSFCIHCGSQV